MIIDINSMRNDEKSYEISLSRINDNYRVERTIHGIISAVESHDYEECRKILIALKRVFLCRICIADVAKIVKKMQTEKTYISGFIDTLSVYDDYLRKCEQTPIYALDKIQIKNIEEGLEVVSQSIKQIIENSHNMWIEF